MDDAGFSLINKSNHSGFLSKLGHFLVNALPVVIKILGVVGTIALVLVSGGIFIHNIDYLHHLLPQVPGLIKEFAAGIGVGLLVFGILSIGKAIFK